MIPILAIAALALFISFCCSLFEAALYALTPSEVEILRQRNAFGAERMARLRDRVDEPIAAILTINTISHTIGSAVCGSLVFQLYAEDGVHAGDYAVAVFVTIFTLAVLVASEIVPKSLGVRFAPRFARLISWPLQVMIWVSWPIARATRWLMNALTRSAGESAPSPEEILVMTQLARRGGALRAQESRWVENALQLSSITARDIMTPRTVVETLPADLKVTDIDGQSPWTHTRLPLIEDGDPDKIVGVVHGKDVFRAMLESDTESRLRDLAHGIAFVPEGMTGDKLLDKFIAEKKHLVAVADEYGGFEGIVTLEDVLECLLGSEIVDEHDRHADMQHVARQHAERRAEQIRVDERGAGDRDE